MKRPLIVGHRGASAHCPENTMASFRRAMEDGADGIELDVQLSSDGVPVVMHDWTLERCSTGTGKLGSMTSLELAELDVGSWFSDEFAQERLPRLADVLEAFPEAGLIDIELKQETVRDTGLEAAVLGNIKEAGAAERVMLSSFNPFVMRRLARLAPDIPRAYIYSPVVKPRLLASPLGRWLAAAPLHKPDAAYLGNEVPENTFVWTVNEPGLAVELARKGYRGLITDDPAAVREAIEAALREENGRPAPPA